MVPYQLSDPTTCQPAEAARPATVPARPVMPELLKTSTTTFERSTAGLDGLGWCGSRVRRTLGLGVGWTLGLCAALGCTARSVGPVDRVATQPTPAIATAMMHRIITGDGKTTPRSSSRRIRPRTRAAAPSGRADAPRASGV